MIDQISGRPGVLAYLAAIGQVAFWTVGYYVVGTLPESYHARKGNAWARINAYHRAAWHFRKYLEYSDDSFGRASLAWCYANLGMPERSPPLDCWWRRSGLVVTSSAPNSCRSLRISRLSCRLPLPVLRRTNRAIAGRQPLPA